MYGEKAVFLVTFPQLTTSIKPTLFIRWNRKNELKLYKNHSNIENNQRWMLLLAKCSWNGQEGNWFCLGTSSDRPLVTMMDGPFPCYPRYTIPREDLSTKGLNSSLFRWNVGFMIGGESHSLKFFLLIQSPKCCAWIAHMSYVQRSTLEDHNGCCSPGCTWQSVSCTRPGICRWISSKQSL